MYDNKWKIRFSPIPCSRPWIRRTHIQVVRLLRCIQNAWSTLARCLYGTFHGLLWQGLLMAGGTGAIQSRIFQSDVITTGLLYAATSCIVHSGARCILRTSCSCSADAKYTTAPIILSCASVGNREEVGATAIHTTTHAEDLGRVQEVYEEHCFRTKGGGTKHPGERGTDIEPQPFNICTTRPESNL